MKRLALLLSLLALAAAPARAADPATSEAAALVAEADRLCLYAPVDFARADELLRRAEAAERLARLLLREGPAGEPEAKRLLKLAHKDPFRFCGVAGRALRALKENGPADALRILDDFYPADPATP